LKNFLLLGKYQLLFHWQGVNLKTINPAGLVEGMYIVFLVFTVLILPIILSYYLARKKNRSPLGWVALTLIFSWPIVLGMLLFVKGEKAGH